MPTFQQRTRVPQPADTVWSWHARGEPAFHRLLPPWHRMEVQHFPDTLQDGATGSFELQLGPARVPWSFRLENVRPGDGFVDEALTSPFRDWRHTHRFRDSAGQGVLDDLIDYTLPVSPLSDVVAGRYARRELERMFAWRHRTTTEDLAAHARYADRPRLRVGITGASGMVGTELSAFLRAGGHTVVPFTRQPSKPGTIHWDPANGTLNPDDLRDLDAVVHLAGENVAARRWTDEQKARIRDSRVKGTTLIARALAQNPRPMPLICASAVGIYGHPQGLVDESTPPGDGFLADVGSTWEASADPARDAGLRVVHLRFGIILSGRGGALPAMLPAFRAGVGGVMGTGRQGLDWIALDDVLNLCHEALFDPTFVGPLNAVAPVPTDHATFIHTLGRVLCRPTVVPIPGFVIRTLMGEMGDALLLRTPRVRASVLLDRGYRWRRPDLTEALAIELGYAAFPDHSEP